MHADNRKTLPLYRNHKSTKLPSTVVVFLDFELVLWVVVTGGIPSRLGDISLGVVVEGYSVGLRDDELFFDGCGVVLCEGGEV